MAKLTTGILAHVDAGKTTLSEALLFQAGSIRKLGRVDSKDTFLDTNSIERNRGITIFSKQAILNNSIMLIDTPGHVDFSAEMERTLSVLDAAILLVNASDGIQSHTKTLWTLLERYGIPTLIFVNKMDMPSTDKNAILSQLKETFSQCIVDFSDAAGTLASGGASSLSADASSQSQAAPTPSAAFQEDLANCNDTMMELYLNGAQITTDHIKQAISKRETIPCIFGSALKMQGIDQIFPLLQTYFEPKPQDPNFGCFVYKITYDKQNNRLTHLKVTGGTLKVKDEINGEKTNEIRIYSGEKFESVKEVASGEICTVTGLRQTKSGQAYGSCNIKSQNRMESALIYTVNPPETVDLPTLMGMLRKLEEELPELQLRYSEETKTIQMMLMGQIQTEVVTQLMQDRYGVEISFGDEKIAYKETIESPVEGVGHYEPLRHYAEVHLKLSPLPQGSGMHFKSELRVDQLDTNWQRLILTHLMEKQHLGVLTGSPITDMQIEVTAGRAHLKHTEGGDFRQSTYRAIRHGLMQAKSILLEPVYQYEISVPETCTGRVMNDIEKMHGNCTITQSKAGTVTMTGTCPVATMKNYANDLRTFSKGQGTISLTVASYQKCHNQDQVVQQTAYHPDADLQNPASSVFCSHGAGFVVPWQEVTSYMHIK